MGRVIRASVAAARAGALGERATRGLDMVAQARDVAAEALRHRRDPAVVAERRRVAARRRLVAWSLIAVVLAAAGAASLVEIVRGTVTAGSVAGLVLAAGLLVYAVIGSVTAAVDLRRRAAIVRQLPAPGPRRGAVAAVIRPTMQRLDGYSDALRAAVSSLGFVHGRQASAQIASLRNETVAAADAAEVRLRTRAAELTALARAQGSSLDQMADQLRRDIEAGVDEYGSLVAAAADAAGASRSLEASTPGQGRLRELTEQLTALAAGMRDLTSRSE